MAKPSFDDIAQPSNQGSSEGAHSIRNVQPPVTQEREERRARREQRRKFETPPAAPKKKMFSGKIAIWGAAIVILLIALAGAGFLFIGKTTITVVPTQESITLGDNIVHTAYKEPEAGELGYTVLSHSADASREIAATGKEDVSEKASGQIIVYNDFGSASQRLIKNTRFEAPNGDIYRVRNSFVVPGKSGDGLGSIEITVHADTAGEAFNIADGTTRFTIPGLKGDPRFDGFYAVQKGPLTGGFVGERAVVNEGELRTVRQELRDSLKGSVRAGLTAKQTDTQTVFEDAIFVSYESLPVTYAEGDKAVVREKATAHAIAFNDNALGRALAEQALTAPAEGGVTLKDSSALTFAVLNADDLDVVADSLVQFTLIGTTSLTWDIDTAALAQDLVGKHSGALTTVMSGYPGIKSARATIRPFWKNEFPTDASNIIVEIEDQS